MARRDELFRRIKGSTLVNMLRESSAEDEGPQGVGASGPLGPGMGLSVVYEADTNVAPSEAVSGVEPNSVSPVN